MPEQLVNLDALVPREDFEVVEEPDTDWQKPFTLSIRDLEPSAFFYSQLRKPDFQRETANWPVEKVVDFIRSFLTGDLIPAIILWKAGKSVFVIDGAHRLGALVAWVHNDYGDQEVSRKFFNNFIPDEQQDAADKVRQLIKKQLGTYQEHMDAVTRPDTARLEVRGRAQRLASLAVQLQWVTGDAKKAEASFFKINQEAVPIDKTELRILRSRGKPNAIAARVIVRNATGHRYWKKFDKETQEQIESTGREIYTTLFEPTLKTPLKTLDIPIGGRGYGAQALPLIFEMVNIANDVKVVDSKRKLKVDAEPEPSDAAAGIETAKFLKQTKRIVHRISGTNPGSLGLHPAVYFYSAAGRYQPTAFLAMVSFMRELDRRNGGFKQFTHVRKRFEEFVLGHKAFSNQVTLKLGSGPKGFDRLRDLYLVVLDGLKDGKSDGEIIQLLKHNERLSFVTVEPPPERKRRQSKFNTETKSAVFLREALQSPVKCKVCSGLIHVNSLQVDHIIRKQDGGLAIADNGQLTHPYCNTGFKEAQHAQSQKTASPTKQR